MGCGAGAFAPDLIWLAKGGAVAAWVVLWASGRRVETLGAMDWCSGLLGAAEGFSEAEADAGTVAVDATSAGRGWAGEVLGLDRVGVAGGAEPGGGHDDRGAGAVELVALLAGCAVTLGLWAEHGRLLGVDLVAGAVALYLKRGVFPQSSLAMLGRGGPAECVGEMLAGRLDPAAGFQVDHVLELMLGVGELLACVGVIALPVFDHRLVAGGGLVKVDQCPVIQADRGVDEIDLRSERQPWLAAACDRSQPVKLVVELVCERLVLGEMLGGLLDLFERVAVLALAGGRVAVEYALGVIAGLARASQTICQLALIAVTGLLLILTSAGAGALWGAGASGPDPLALAIVLVAMLAGVGLGPGVLRAIASGGLVNVAAVKIAAGPGPALGVAAGPGRLHALAGWRVVEVSSGPDPGRLLAGVLVVEVLLVGEGGVDRGDLGL